MNEDPVNRPLLGRALPVVFGLMVGLVLGTAVTPILQAGVSPSLGVAPAYTVEPSAAEAASPATSTQGLTSAGHRLPVEDPSGSATEGVDSMFSADPAEYARFVDATRGRLAELLELRAQVLARNVLITLERGHETRAFAELAKSMVRGAIPTDDEQVLLAYARAASLEDVSAGLPADFSQRLLHACGASEQEYARYTSRERSLREAVWVRRLSVEIGSVATVTQDEQRRLESTLSDLAAEQGAITVVDAAEPGARLRQMVLRRLDERRVLPADVIALVRRLWTVNGLIEEA